MQDSMVFISIDANEIGKKIEKFILNEQHDKLKHFSKMIAGNVSDIADKIADFGGEIIMSGGDNILAIISNIYVAEVLNYVKNINNTEEIVFSIGIGKNSALSYMALKYAKVSSFFAVNYDGENYIEIDKTIQYDSNN